MKLAIIMPAYNGENTLREALGSLQNISTGWNHVEELIVCDDGSSDGTLSILKSTTFDKCPLRLVANCSNNGEAFSYNTMVNLLSDDVNWFLIMHQDDIALECFLERNLEIIKRCNGRVAAVSSNYYVFGSVQPTLGHSRVNDEIIFRGSAKNEIMHTAMVGCWWHISGSLVNKALWQKFGGTNPSLHNFADWDLILRWQSAGYLVGHSLIPTTKYRISQNQLSSRLYITCRDVEERTKVILGFPEIFSANMRRQWARRIGGAAFRRVCKFFVLGKAQLAVRGMLIGINCVFALMRG
jgi:glycosyltransferase involved in cell wall biosynthesis